MKRFGKIWWFEPFHVGRHQFPFCSIFHNLHVDISESQYKRNKTVFLVVGIQLYALPGKDITHRRDSHCSFFGSTWVNSEDIKEQLCRRLGRAPSGTGRLGHLAAASHLALWGRTGHPHPRWLYLKPPPFIRLSASVCMGMMDHGALTAASSSCTTAKPEVVMSTCCSCCHHNRRDITAKQLQNDQIKMALLEF